MKALEGAFGMKKLFTRALSDNRPWKEKIKAVGGKYSCIQVQVHHAYFWDFLGHEYSGWAISGMDHFRDRPFPG